jgi:putative FmdB family regulatory protein
MPIYEYACLSCAHRFETIQRVSDDPVARCPKCEGAVERLLSSPAIQFKGSGWYVTDYARKGANTADAGKPAEKSGEATKDGSTSSEKTATISAATTTSPTKDS